MTAACWFRCDLRTLDNPALDAAIRAGSEVALFIISPAQWCAHGDAPAKQWLWREAVRDLGRQLAWQGISLKLLLVDDWQDIPQQLLSFCKTHRITAIHCNREAGVHERRRDRSSYVLLQEHGVALNGHDGQTLLPLGSLKTSDGNFYRVFTPFARAALTLLAQEKYDARLVTPDTGQCQPVHPENPSTALQAFLEQLDSGWPAIDLSADQIAKLEATWTSTQDGALSRLQQFVADTINHYDTRRDCPAANATSCLSPYLAAGLISPRQCLFAARMANAGEIDSGNPGIRSWINELLWREFYRHLLFGFPRLSMHKPLRLQTERVQWRDAPEDFLAWCQGRTGFPLIDAAMRQLHETGWMHNRLRMVVAMFLSKNLLIDWRRGEHYFMQHLIDGDLAANNGGWQWSASTGADSVPYFRVFNPLTQSQKFDPDGTFLRTWLPELRDLDKRSIHRPSELQRAARGYPAEIVDLKTSRQRAIATFEQIQS